MGDLHVALIANQQEEGETNHRPCIQCSVPTARKDLKVCSHCAAAGFKVHYCSRECQTKAWPRHKKECAGQLRKLTVKIVHRQMMGGRGVYTETLSLLPNGGVRAVVFVEKEARTMSDQVFNDGNPQEAALSNSVAFWAALINQLGEGATSSLIDARNNVLVAGSANFDPIEVSLRAHWSMVPVQWG